MADGQKTEKATPKRREDERKKGNIFMSREAVTVASMLAAFYTLKAFAPFIFGNVKGFFMSFLLSLICS